MLLSNIADQIFLKTDQIILAKMYNTAIVAVYAVGSQIYNLQSHLLAQTHPRLRLQLPTSYMPSSNLMSEIQLLTEHFHDEECEL